MAKTAANIPLATEPQPILDPWLRKLAKNKPMATEIGLKKGPLRTAHPSKVYITSAPTPTPPPQL